MFEDKTLVCKDCGKEFVWTAGEQEFYASRGFENQPQRFKPFRDALKNGGARSNSGERQMFDAVCAACGKEFVWTAGEQEFYASRGFENQPQRCKPCRDARKNGGARSNSGERQMFDAVCAACGKACKVPFQPREDRPVYCSDCFARMKQN